MALIDLLKQVNFGSRTAEDEMAQLGQYFVETAQWTRISAGEKDVVYGAKGAGKSAIYAVMAQREDAFRREGIFVKSGEQARGEPVFAELMTDPPQSEAEWRLLWRAYFIGLIAEVLEENAIEVDAAKRVFAGLEREGLREGKGPKAWLRGAQQFAKRIRMAKTVEVESGVDFATGTARIGGRLALPDDSPDVVKAAAAVASLLEDANKALEEAGLEVWIALDRLDAAFGDPLIEAPAIRALMRVYLDFTTFDQVTPKIFLRTDIWKEISADGFREGSHVVRSETIAWSRDTLLNLAIRRLLENEALVEHFGVDPAEVLASLDAQEELFERLFERDEEGGASPSMLDWAVEGIADGHGRSAPRELIHLLGELRDRQIERLGVGRQGPGGEAIFEDAVRAEALTEVSGTHLVQTLYNEISKVRGYVEALRGGPVGWTEEGLKDLWGDSVENAAGVIKTLVDAGFLRRLPPGEAGFEVAMLYRPALELSYAVESENGGRDGA